MAITAPTDTTKIRPLSGAVIRRFTAGTGGVTAGVAVSMGSDGAIMADGDIAAPKTCLGIALQTVAATGRVDVVTHGAVTGYSGATIGANIYPADAGSGVLQETASTNKHAVGVAEAADTVFVRPGYIA